MALTTIPSELSSVSGISDSSTSTAITIDSSQNVTFAGNITTGSNTISGVLSSVTGSLGSAATATTQAASDNSTKLATTAYVTTALANMVDSAPSTLNTLNELAAALGDDANFSTTVTNSIATKAPLASPSLTGTVSITGNFPQLFFVDTAGSDLDAYIVNNANGLFIGKTNSPSVSNDIVSIDLSTGNVGIGVSPSRNLDIQGTGDTLISIVSPAANQAALFFGDTDSDSVGRVAYDNSDNSMRFTTNASEAMRIDSSGNVLVGTTDDVVWNNSANSAADNGHNLRDDGRAGFAYYNATAGANATVNVNRTGSDGDLIRLFKSGTIIGSIGNDSTSLYIGSGSTGVKFGSSAMWATTGGGSTNSDNAKDLGASNVRWRNLYLSGKAQADTFQFAQNSSASGATEAVYRPTTGEMAFKTNSAERMRIDSSGNVGIGTSSPAHPLAVSKNLTGVIASFTNQTSADFQINLSSGVSLLTPSTGVLALGTSNTERMRIDSSGNVGIGTNDPSTALDVNGVINVRTSGFQFGRITTNNTSASDGGLTFQTVSGGSFGEAMRIDSSGNVGIGASSPSQKLDVSSSASGVIARITGPNSYNAESGLEFSVGRAKISGVLNGTGGTPGTSLRFYTMPDGGSVTERMRIASDGSFSLSQGTGNNFRVIRDGDNTIEVGNYNATDGYRSTNYLSSTHTFFVASAGAGSGSRAVDIDTSGNLLVGTTAVNGAGITLSSTNNYGYFSRSGDAALFVNRSTSDGALIELRRADVEVGSIQAVGDDLNIGTGDTALLFVDSIDAILPTTTANPAAATRDNAIDLGRSATRFDDIYATNGTIQTSDRNEKQDIEALSDAEQRVAVAAKGLLRKFRWIDAVEAKGDDARIHFGIIAQDLQDAFTAEGLDAGRYAMFISSTWTDDDGNEQTRLGVRYSELLAFIISAI